MSSTSIHLCIDREAWDTYVASHPSACNYHGWRWRGAIEETYGHEPYYLCATRDGSIEGILPLFSIRSRLFGDSLVSVPFFSYGGPLADSPEQERALMNHAVCLAGQIGAKRIELRHGVLSSAEWQVVSEKVTMKVAIPNPVDQLWDGLSARLRKRIRHARKAGFEARWGGIEEVGAFYPVFATNMRNLGTPVYPRTWFENLCRAGGEDVRILTLWWNQKPVAGAFLIAFRDTLELPWAASLPESRRDFGPLLLYWTLLEWAAANGFRQVDLGRCNAGSGNHDFKKHWTQQEIPLNWHYWTPEGAPLAHLARENGKFRIATQVWKFLPLAVANQLGPRIVKALP